MFQVVEAPARLSDLDQNFPRIFKEAFTRLSNHDRARESIEQPLIAQQVMCPFKTPLVTLETAETDPAKALRPPRLTEPARTPQCSATLQHAYRLPPSPVDRLQGFTQPRAARRHGITAAGLFYCRMANGTRRAVCLFSQPLTLGGVNYAYSTWHTCCISWHTIC